VKKDTDIAGATTSRRPSAEMPRRCTIWPCSTPDGGGKGANYKDASQWFRKAADRGVADSQFNLGILYARGIGVEQNLAESSNGSAWRRRRATRTPRANATISPSGSTPSRWPRQSWRSRRSRPSPSQRRHQCGDPGRGMGLRTGAGQYGKARSQAGFDQAGRR